MFPQTNLRRRLGLGLRFLYIAIRIDRYLLYLYQYGRFPNPHIRTNAFMIERNRFLSLYAPAFKNKEDAYKFESGRRSMTKQIIAQELKPVVVDRNGAVYGALPSGGHRRLFGQTSNPTLLWRTNGHVIMPKRAAAIAYFCKTMPGFIRLVGSWPEIRLERRRAKTCRADGRPPFLQSERIKSGGDQQGEDRERNYPNGHGGRAGSQSGTPDRHNGEQFVKPTTRPRRGRSLGLGKRTGTEWRRQVSRPCD